MTSASGSSSDPVSPGDGMLSPSDHLDQALGRFLAESRVEAAAAARRRRHDMRSAATEDATLLGLFVDLAETGVPTTVAIVDGSNVSGTVGAVGTDYVTIVASGAGVIVRERSIVGFELPSGTTASGIDREPTIALRFGDLFAPLAEEPAAVRVHAGGEIVAGVLTMAGRDVVAIESETRRPRWIRVDAIDAIRVG